MTLTLRQRLIGNPIQLRWWAFRNWLRRCPACGQRGYSPATPKWSEDKVAQMLGIADKGCPTCGKEVP